MKIETAEVPAHTAPMDETTADALFERATDLSYAAFGEEVSDDHIEWAFHRLVMHWQWGLPADGVVTVH